jgi:excisionase family DNA binding protein
MPQNQRMKNVSEAASELGLSVACLRRWIAERRIGYVRLGRAIRISSAEIERMMAEGAVPARERRNGRGD